MSETDEEGAFQSADEGEEGKGSTSSPIKAPSKDPVPARPPPPSTGGRRPIKVLPPDESVDEPSPSDVVPQGPPVVTSPAQEKIERGGPAEGGQPNQAAAAAEKPKAGGWGSWGNWGANLLNTASSSVSTFTSQVGEGFQNVLDTVESSLGAPDAEELAKQEKLADVAKEPDETPDGHTQQTEGEVEATEEKEVRTPSEKAESVKSNKSTESKQSEGKQSEARSEGKQSEGKPEGAAGWLSWGGISGITSMVKDTGKTLVSGGEKVLGGGLNVLETIGKKTYDVIAEGDHGLKETLRNKPNLSQILRDAKKKAEQNSKAEAEFEEVRKAHFGMLFDDYNGLVHLEALEAVSNQCESRVQNLLMVLGGDQLDASKHELIIIKEIFQIEEFSDDEAEEPKADEDHEFEQLATEHIGNLGLNVSGTRLIEAHHKSRLWLKDCADEQSQGVRINAKACQSLAMYDGLKKRNIAQEIHQMAIQSLAELTAVSVEQFHKVAQQLLLRQEGTYSVFKSKATCLFNLVRVIGKEVDIVAVQFTHRLNKAAEDAEEPDSVNPFITNIYLEATNSKTYIQDAFQLLLPVLQQAALQANTES